MSNEAKARRDANRLLAAAIGIKFHEYLPIEEINAALNAAGFAAMEPAIYCGREGRVHEQVGARSWIAMSWWKFENTGRYEVVAYVS